MTVTVSVMATIKTVKKGNNNKQIYDNNTKKNNNNNRNSNKNNNNSFDDTYNDKSDHGTSSNNININNKQ